MPSYILTLLHFNLQYCAGGLDGLYATWPTDEQSIEDQIIDESFDPVLDVLDAHPTWTFDIELQAYMIEVIAERRPEVLDHLRTLADSGQVELVSFHYSDQLWTAYPWRDQEVSLALTREIFEDNDLPLSDVVWTQEGQFGQGMLERMPEAGYAIAVMPHNLAEFTWGANPASPTYTYAGPAGDVTAVPGGSGFANADFSVGWHFFDDGELYTTGDMDPYLGPAFVYNAAATAERVAELEAAERAGARVIGVHDYVDAVTATPSGTPIPLPPVIDGTWQPDDTTNMYRWMGGGGLWGDSEHDDLVLTSNVRARHIVEAAEVAGGDPDLIKQAWKALLLGEVSDATGWNPYPTEPQYALDHAAEAEALAVESLGDRCGEVTVDLRTRTVVTDTVYREGTAESAAPIEVTVTGRTADTRWFEVDSTVTPHGVRQFALRLALPAEGEPPILEFPWDGEQITTVPALMDAPVTIDASMVHDPVGIALPTGLLRLSDRVWLLQETSTTHLAAVLSRSAGTATFSDETDAGEEMVWQYRVFVGDDTVSDEDVQLSSLTEANLLNVAPVVALHLPDCASFEDTGGRSVNSCPPPGIFGGCCCTSAPNPASLYALLPLAFALAQRRRPVSRRL